MTTFVLSEQVLSNAQTWVDVAHDALRNTPYGDLRQVECRQLEDRLVLFGFVSNYYLKQVAQCVVLKLCGSAIPVENRLEVSECTYLSDQERHR